MTYPEITRENLLAVSKARIPDSEVAAFFGKSISAIFRARKRWDIPPGTPAPKLANHTAAVTALLIEGLGRPEIAKRLGVTRKVVDGVAARGREKGILPPAPPPGHKSEPARALILAGTSPGKITEITGLGSATITRLRRRMIAEGIAVPPYQHGNAVPKPPKVKVGRVANAKPAPKPKAEPKPDIRQVSAIALRATEKRAREAAGPQPGAPMPQASDRIPGLAAEQLAIVQDSHGCLWGIGHVGAQGFHFCGEPRRMGKSYCGHHAERSVQPAKGSLAAAERVPAAYRMAAE